MSLSSETNPQAMPLSDLSAYTYGTTRLGDGSIPFAERVQVARAAMKAGIWFHTSHSYGDALQVLRTAFDEDRSQVPPVIVKMGWDSIDQIRDQITQNREPLGIERIDIGQLCLGSKLADEFRNNGPCYDGFKQLQAEGIVGQYVLEVFPWTSAVAFDGFRAGYPDGVVEGLIFYLNPLQRFVSNELWDLIQERNIPVIAMRTVCGGSVQRLRDNESAPEYLRLRAAQVAPLFERSGCASWTEFCVRFVYGFPQVRSTVGSTSHPDRLQEFLNAVPSQAPLPAAIQAELLALQRDWASTHDSHAAPWSM